MNLLPCDGKFSACFGGSLTSLNAQVGRFLFESQATAEPSVDRMAALLNSIETRSAAPQSWMPRPHLDATKRCRCNMRLVTAKLPVSTNPIHLAVKPACRTGDASSESGKGFVTGSKYYLL